jgi:hypothetical protein
VWLQSLAPTRLLAMVCALLGATRGSTRGGGGVGVVVTFVGTLRQHVWLPSLAQTGLWTNGVSNQVGTA